MGEKIAKLLFAFLGGIIISGCDKNKMPLEDNFDRKNYEIKEIDDSSDTKYEYIIYDDHHNELDRGNAFRTRPIIENVNNLLKLCISEGTGLRNCKFYNTKNRKISTWFETPILSNKDVVVRLNSITSPNGIIVESIFEDKKIYKEYSVDFSNKEFWPIENIKFIDDDKIEIIYISAVDNRTERKIINLY